MILIKKHRYLKKDNIIKYVTNEDNKTCNYRFYYHYDAIYYSEVLLNILNLLTHLLNQHFQFNRGTGDIGIDGF